MSMAFQRRQRACMWLESTQMQFKRTLVTPDVERGSKRHVDDGSWRQCHHLLGLVKGYHVQHHTLLGNAKPGVLPLMAEKAKRSGQLNPLGVEQRQRVTRAARPTASQAGE